MPPTPFPLEMGGISDAPALEDPFLHHIFMRFIDEPEILAILSRVSKAFHRLVDDPVLIRALFEGYDLPFKGEETFASFAKKIRETHFCSPSWMNVYHVGDANKLKRLMLSLFFYAKKGRVDKMLEALNFFPAERLEGYLMLSELSLINAETNRSPLSILQNSGNQAALNQFYVLLIPYLDYCDQYRPMSYCRERVMYRQWMAELSNEELRHCLSAAIRLYDGEALSYLLNLLRERDIQIDAVFKANPLLCLAVQVANHEAVEALLEQGASPNVRNVSGQTPLYLACFTNNIPLVKCLLKQNTRMNTWISDKSPLLYAAIYHNNPTMFHLLLKAGADIGKVDFEGRTVFHVLFDKVTEGELPEKKEIIGLILKALRRKGLNPHLFLNQKSYSIGVTVFDIAKQRGEVGAHLLAHLTDALAQLYPQFEAKRLCFFKVEGDSLAPPAPGASLPAARSNPS